MGRHGVVHASVVTLRFSSGRGVGRHGVVHATVVTLRFSSDSGMGRYGVVQASVVTLHFRSSAVLPLCCRTCCIINASLQRRIKYTE